jgi:hypothetical protein
MVKYCIALGSAFLWLNLVQSKINHALVYTQP